MSKTERMRREATANPNGGARGGAAKGIAVNRNAANRNATESSEASQPPRAGPTRRNVILFAMATILLVAWMAVLLFMALHR